MRYYAQHTEVPKIFLSRHKTGWLVFDREITTRQGDVLPILFCTNRYVAFITRDALNAQEIRGDINQIHEQKRLAK